MSDPATYIGEPGYVAERALPDGRTAWIILMTFGKARLVVNKIDAHGIDDGGLDDGWCYDSPALACVALAVWNGVGEPDGWMRHPTSGRRLSGGNASKEYVWR